MILLDGYILRNLQILKIFWGTNSKFKFSLKNVLSLIAVWAGKAGNAKMDEISEKFQTALDLPSP